jgi:hypothetical protein
VESHVGYQPGRAHSLVATAVAVADGAGIAVDQAVAVETATTQKEKGSPAVLLETRGGGGGGEMMSVEEGEGRHSDQEDLVNGRANVEIVEVGEVLGDGVEAAEPEASRETEKMRSPNSPVRHC